MGGILSSVLHRCALYITAKIITLPMIRVPFQDLSDPEEYGLKNAVNLRIQFPSGQDGKCEWMGAWLIRPHPEKHGQSDAARRWREVERRDEDSEEPDDNDGGDKVYMTDPDETVVLYLHGNAKTRADAHRVALYRVLSSMGLPVLAIDYRGYADSSSMFVNTETSFVEDAALALSWLGHRSHPQSKILVWGHSLGTGVAVALGKHLSTQSQRSSRPELYVLEAPFLSIRDVAESNFICKFVAQFANLPLHLIDECSLSLDSGKYIASIREPIAIMHAKDDTVVPYTSGQSLYNKAIGEGCNATMITFDGDLGLGHNDIYKSDRMKLHLEEFLSSAEAN